MRNPEDGAATVERDLEAVEAALASGVAGHDDPAARELQELALALQADASRPAPAFAEELRERVDAGFPHAPGSARKHQADALERLTTRAAGAPGALRRLLPAAGVVVAILVPLVVAITLVGTPQGGGGDDDAGGGGGVGGGSAQIAPAPPEAGGGDGGGAGVPVSPSPNAGRATDALVAPRASRPAGGGFAPGRRERRIERTFSLELEVPLDEMNRVADDVTDVTSRNGGFVLNSSVDTGQGGGGGDFELRIPSNRLRPALRDLAELAPVVRQSQDGRDVTRQHATASDRLQAARAERRGLLRRLEVAGTDEEAEAIRRQLDLVAGEINGLRGQLRGLRLRTDYAVVTVSLLVAEEAVGGGSIGGSFDDALADAGDLLVGVLGVLIRALAVAVPLGLIALVAWLAARVLRRRRRESALI